MKKNKKTGSVLKLFLSTIILVYSTVIQFSIPSFVLCFGDDGHIAFEQTGGDNQCDHEDERDHPIHKHKNLAHQKDDCQDIPLLNVFSSLYLEKNGKIKLFNLALESGKTYKSSYYLATRLNLFNDFAFIHSSMKSLQATILLI